MGGSRFDLSLSFQNHQYASLKDAKGVSAVMRKRLRNFGVWFIASFFRVELAFWYVLFGKDFVNDIIDRIKEVKREVARIEDT